jgi:hypothetical protein
MEFALQLTRALKTLRRIPAPAAERAKPSFKQ